MALAGGSAFLCISRSTRFVNHKSTFSVKTPASDSAKDVCPIVAETELTPVIRDFVVAPEATPNQLGVLGWVRLGLGCRCRSQG